MEDFEISVEFQKASIDDDLRLVGGFAYVAKRDGELLVDSQGDSIEPDVLRDAVHEFMKGSRTLGVMHFRKADGTPVSGGQIVEMAVFAGDFRPPGMDPNIDALWIVAKVDDDFAWARVKSGDFSGFSIGGKAVAEAA